MPKKIVVVDDEVEIVEMLKTMLERAGYAVCTVTHGARLRNVIDREKPDLLLLDVLLPGLDGYSLQLQLSQDEATKHIPVIIVTALPASQTLFTAFEQVKMFMTKPFKPEFLLEKVREVLGE